MNQEVKKGFQNSLSVMAGYLVLGIGFGVYAQQVGFSAWIVFLMSLCLYAGSMQFVLVSLLLQKASLLTIALTTLMVNARHLFYGLSMIRTYQSKGLAQTYSIFALTDETYSLVCNEVKPFSQQKTYYTCLSGLNHLYWITGTMLGALVGKVIPFPTKGIEFSMTALFLTVFLDQWKDGKQHFAALLGVGSSIVCLFLFGKEHFLIPTMLLILLVLWMKERRDRE